ncbi:MAG: MgtC/SapB family protein, partial [Lachnospiraceae bacterium]|nr:MgtC/SapB family protein [Lachnospiraceae bacterium]
VRGLTTAACLWMCACVGLASGAGFVEGVVYALILIVITLKLLAKVDMIIHERANVFSFYLEFNANTSIASFMDEIRKKEIRISAFDITKNKIKGEGPSAVLTLEIKNKELKKTLLHDIQEMEYVRYAEEL